MEHKTQDCSKVKIGIHVACSDSCAMSLICLYWNLLTRAMTLGLLLMSY